MVNIQKPFGNPQKVLQYLSRYVFRIAISDNRIIRVENNKVLFSLKNYRAGTYTTMWLDVDEFIRRFLLHLLPKGFFKVRYYGIFSSRYRKKNIEQAKHLISESKNLLMQEKIEDGETVFLKQDTVWDEILTAIQNFKKPNCPKCFKGYMCFAGLAPG